MTSHTAHPPVSTPAPKSIFQTAIVICFHLLLIVTPFFFTWVNEELFEFNKMLVVYGLSAVIGGLWVLRMIWEQQPIWRRTWLDIPLWIFVASQVASTVLSIHPRTSWLGYYTRFHGGLLSTLSYTLLFHALVSNVEAHHARKLLISALVAAVGVALYAIPESYGWSPSCTLITGQLNAGVSCWVQDVQTRVFATFGQPNWLAAYFITLLPFAAVFAISPVVKTAKTSYTPNFIKSWLWYVALGLIVAALLFTKSRSGALGLIGGTGVWVVGIGILLLKYRASSQKTAVTWFNNLIIGSITIAAIITISAAVWGLPFSLGELQTRLGFASNTVSVQPSTTAATAAPASNRLEEGGTDSGEIRKIVWEGAWKVWQRYPIFGSGVETFAYSYYLDRPLAHNQVSEWDFLYNKAHNEFLNFLATTGAVGLGAYLLLLGSIGWLGLKLLLSNTEAESLPLTMPPQLLGLALLSSLTALSISNFLGFSTVMVATLLWLLPAIVEVITRGENQPPQTQTVLTSSNWQFGASALVGIAMLLSLGWVWQTWEADRLYAQGKATLQAGQLETGLELLSAATEMRPDEALFFDELASVYSSLARELSAQNQATAATQLAELSIVNANTALSLNDVHLNFYKTRARVFINLASLNPEFLQYASEALIAAEKRAPTDPKIVFNLGLVAEAQEDIPMAVEYMTRATTLKTDYGTALAELAKVYEVTGQLEAAISTYQRLLALNPADILVETHLTKLQASQSANINK